MRLLSFTLATAASLAGFAIPHSNALARSPLGHDFVRLLQLAPDYESKADEALPRGLDHEYAAPVFGCDGAPPRSFSFAESDRGALKIISAAWGTTRKLTGSLPAELAERLRSGDAVPSGVDRRAQGFKDPHFGYDEDVLADFIRVQNGWFLAFNAGEWGGGVVWLPDRDVCAECGGVQLSEPSAAVFDLVMATPDVVYAGMGSDAHGLFGMGSIGKFVRLPSTGVWQPDLVTTRTATNVRAIHYRDGIVAGATIHGPVVIERDGVVRYNTDTRPGKKVQAPNSVHILKDGTILIGGRDSIAVYEPGSMVPVLYAPRDCKIVFLARKP